MLVPSKVLSTCQYLVSVIKITHTKCTRCWIHTDGGHFYCAMVCQRGICYDPESVSKYHLPRIIEISWCMWKLQQAKVGTFL